MSEMIEKIALATVLSVVGIVVGILMAGTVYLIFIVTPVQFYTQAECLRNGYPKAIVTIGLERYCTTLDGAVTVTVKKLSRQEVAP